MIARDGTLGTLNSVQFVALVPRLRTLAARLLSRERPGHTLQATALVSEAFLKLSRSSSQALDERHLFNLSARAMRQVLIDYGRTRGTYQRISVETVASLLPSVDSRAETDARIAIRSSFLKLRRMDTVVAETLRLRFIAGLTMAETSRLQRRPEWRVRADCNFGLRWIQGQLSNAPR